MRHLLLVFVLAFALWAALTAVDFGTHWDEHIIILALQRMIRTGLYLPSRYNYPSMVFYLPFGVLLPDLITQLAAGARGADLSEALISIGGSHAFLLRTRTLFAVITLLAVLWTYGTVWWWRRRVGEALAAAAIFGCSFEIGYHARWIAPDAVMMQFGALAVMLLVRSRSEGRWAPRGWLRLAAIAAGLACATKYPGGILLVPLVLAPLFDPRVASTRRHPLFFSAELAAIFSLTYLVITPATFLDAKDFVDQVQAVAEVYRVQGHAGYTVVPGFDHLSKIAVYLALVAYSHQPLLAICFAFAAVIGAVALCREEPRLAVLVLSAPVLYLIYFGQMRVMIVRNLMVVMPFGAMLAGRGLGAIQQAVAPLLVRWLGRIDPALAWLGRATVPIAVALMLVYNAAWLTEARGSIVHRREVQPVDVLARLVTSATEPLALSPELTRDLGQRDAKALAKVTTVPGPSTPIAIYPREIPAWMWKLPSNTLGVYHLLPTGPYDVNWDYYASWMDENRILIMPTRTATRAGLVLPH